MIFLIEKFCFTKIILNKTFSASLSISRNFHQKLWWLLFEKIIAWISRKKSRDFTLSKYFNLKLFCLANWNQDFCSNEISKKCCNNIDVSLHFLISCCFSKRATREGLLLDALFAFMFCSFHVLFINEIFITKGNGFLRNTTIFFEDFSILTCQLWSKRFLR